MAGEPDPASRGERPSAGGKTGRRLNRWQVGFLGVIAIAVAVTVFFAMRDVRVPLPLVDLQDAPAALVEQVQSFEERARSGDFDALGELAQLYHANGHASGALEIYEDLTTREPEEARWWYLGGMILSGYGRLDEAEPWLAHAVAIEPDYIPAQLNLADLLLKSNRPVEAEAAYEAVLETDPESAWARHGLARLAVADGRLPEARRRLEQIVAQQPGFFAANSLLATVYERLGETAAAELPRRRARAAERFRDPPDPWLEDLASRCFDTYRLQVMASASEDPERSRELLQRALDLEPRNASVLRQLAELHVRLKELDRARERIDQSITLAPDDPAGYMALVPIYHALQDRAGAERVLRAGLERLPKNAGIHYELAMIAIADDRLKEAEALLERARRLDPAELSAYAKLANVLFRRNEAARAVAVLEDALGRDPNHGPSLILLARYHLREGRRQKAEVLLQRALQAGEQSLEAEALRRELSQ